MTDRQVEKSKQVISAIQVWLFLPMASIIIFFGSKLVNNQDKMLEAQHTFEVHLQKIDDINGQQDKDIDFLRDGLFKAQQHQAGTIITPFSTIQHP